MINQARLIFIHGLEGSSQGDKATLLRGIFPQMLIPDFRGSLDERMQSLEQILGEERGWTVIGSSFGGLMAAKFACQHPAQVRKLVLMAPALIWPEFASSLPAAIDVPTIIFHGNLDNIVPLAPNRLLAEQLFHHLEYHVVDDDHGLYHTAHQIEWQQILE